MSDLWADVRAGNGVEHQVVIGFLCLVGRRLLLLLLHDDDVFLGLFLYRLIGLSPRALASLRAAVHPYVAGVRYARSIGGVIRLRLLSIIIVIAHVLVLILRSHRRSHLLQLHGVRQDIVQSLLGVTSTHVQSQLTPARREAHVTQRLHQVLMMH